MPFSKLLLLYFLTAIVFFIIDIFWLGFAADSIYNKYLGHLRGPTVWPAAIIFYLLFIAGILIFAVVPYLEEETYHMALLYGALFGFFTYMTYELTNLAVIKDWPVGIVFIDIAWGVVLTGSVAWASWNIGRWLMG